MPRSIYQYSNMAPRISGQTSIFGVVFFISKSLSGIERRNKLYKVTILSLKLRSMLQYWYIERDLFEWKKKKKKLCNRRTKVFDCHESIRNQILLSCRKKYIDFFLCLHCLVLWKLRNLGTRVNFRIAFKMLGETNQKNCPTWNDLGTQPRSQNLFPGLGEGWERV